MVMSDLRVEVEIWPFCACTMHPAIIIRTVDIGHWVIVDLAMGQIPHSTQRISRLSNFPLFAMSG